MIVKQYFDIRTDEVQEGFDGSEIRQMDFSSLITNGRGDRIKSNIQDIKDSNGNVIAKVTITKSQECPIEKGKIILNITAPNAQITSQYVTHLRQLSDTVTEIVVLMNTSWFEDNNTSVSDYLEAILQLPADTQDPNSLTIGQYVAFNIDTTSGTLFPESSVTFELQVEAKTNIEEFNDNGYIFNLPDDILVILNERLVVNTNNKSKEYVVVPLNYREYDRMQSKPYSQPLKKQCWRLFNNI